MGREDAKPRSSECFGALRAVRGCSARAPDLNRQVAKDAKSEIDRRFARSLVFRACPSGALRAARWCSARAPDSWSQRRGGAEKKSLGASRVRSCSTPIDLFLPILASWRLGVSIAGTTRGTRAEHQRTARSASRSLGSASPRLCDQHLGHAWSTSERARSASIDLCLGGLGDLAVQLRHTHGTRANRARSASTDLCLGGLGDLAVQRTEHPRAPRKARRQVLGVLATTERPTDRR